MFDKYAKVEMAFPPEEPFTTSDFNMGGLMAIVQGGLGGRISDKGVTQLVAGVGLLLQEL